MVTDNRRENIKSRLIKYVSDLWGYQKADMDGFDPLVDLLLGACSVEFERIGNQIESSHSRSLEKLASLLLPESLTIPQPAHAILKAQSVENTYYLNLEDQFSVEKEIVNPAKPTELQKKSICFAPSLRLPIYDASLDYLLVGGHLLRQQNIHLRETIAHSSNRMNNVENHVWLGIKFNGDPEIIPALRFFFDWKNKSNKRDLLDLLLISNWSLNGNIPLDHQMGYPELNDEPGYGSYLKLLKEWEILAKIDNKINQLYQSHFISLKKQDLKLKDHLKPYPEEFRDYFNQDSLKDLTEPILWLKIEVSPVLPVNELREMQCEINCFPAVNRQLIDNRRPYRMDENLSIIPIKTDDYFLSMNKVADEKDRELKAVPFYNIHQLENNTYTLRKNSVGRFDNRNARHLLQYILELLRDENAAFSALGGTIGAKDIEELDKNINKIEFNLKNKPINQDFTHFLMIKAGKISQIYMSYWSTNGKIANRIPAGSPFKSECADINANSILAVTSSSGGKDKPSEQERIHSFRSSLLSRDRIVTKQDLITACFAELGNTLKSVHVQKGYKIFSGENQGVARVIEVFLTPGDEFYQEEEWEKICYDLSIHLEQKSSSFLPVVVKLTKKKLSYNG